MKTDLSDLMILNYKLQIEHIKKLKDNAKNRQAILDMQNKIKELEELNNG